MNPFDLSPNQLLREVQDFNFKMAQGMQTLSEVGDVEVGASPRDLVYEEDHLQLYRYQPVKPEAELNPVPLVIVYALVNRPYMTDLQQGRSLIQGLLEGGVDVYLVDWGYPDDADRFLTLDDYINGYFNNCIDFVRKAHSLDKVNLLGICQGGTFSLCYSSLHPEKIQNLITTVTPVDFKTQQDMLSHLSQYVDVDLVIDTLGNVSGEVLNWSYLNLKPFRLMAQKYIDFVNLLDDPEQVRNFMRMEKWIFDSPAQAGEAYREFIKQFYQDNKLIKGEVKIGKDTVDLNNISMPVLNIFARDDHLVPPAASQALPKYIGTEDYTEVNFPGGHIGIYVSGKAQKMIPPTVAEWLEERTPAELKQKQ